LRRCRQRSLSPTAEGQLEVRERNLQGARERGDQTPSRFIEMDVSDNLEIHALTRSSDQQPQVRRIALEDVHVALVVSQATAFLFQPYPPARHSGTQALRRLLSARLLFQGTLAGPPPDPD